MCPVILAISLVVAACVSVVVPAKARSLEAEPQLEPGGAIRPERRW
jgi:hypothetical protein